MEIGFGILTGLVIAYIVWKVVSMNKKSKELKESQESAPQGATAPINEDDDRGSNQPQPKRPWMDEPQK